MDWSKKLFLLFHLTFRYERSAFLCLYISQAEAKSYVLYTYHSYGLKYKRFESFGFLQFYSQGIIWNINTIIIVSTDIFFEYKNTFNILLNVISRLREINFIWNIKMENKTPSLLGFCREPFSLLRVTNQNLEALCRPRVILKKWEHVLVATPALPALLPSQR